MRIGFTGTQKGMTDAQILGVQSILLTLATELHHGDCIGADAQADELAHTAGIPVHLHPPSYVSKRAFCQSPASIAHGLPYLQRNREIVDVVEFMVGAPGEIEEQLRSGTWSTIRYARKIERPGTIVFPDGTTRDFGL